MQPMGGRRLLYFLKSKNGTKCKNFAVLLCFYVNTFILLYCRVGFSLLHSAIDCLRGARSSKGHAAASLKAFDLALSEGRMPLNH